MKFFLSLFSIVIFLSTAPAAAAFTPAGSQMVILPEGEVVEGDYFATGEVIDIRGTVNGDVYAAGGQITVSGEINGDLLATGGQISIPGQVNQNIRAAAGQIQIGGTVGRNLTAAAGFINILEQAQLFGNAVLTAGQVNSSAPISGDVTTATGSTMITGPIGGNLTAYTDSLSLLNTANIQGNLTYTSPNQASLDPDATIQGTTTFHQPEQIAEQIENSQVYQATEEIRQSFDNGINVVRLIFFATQIALGLMIINIVPNFSLRFVSFIETKTINTFLAGLITILVVPIIVLLLAISIIGIPLAIFTGFTYVVFIFISQILFAYWLGTRFLQGLKRKANRNITFLIGIGIYYILTSISIIGIITALLATIFGTGAMVLTKHKTYTSARKLKIV